METPRLLIRSYDYGDEDAIIELITSNREYLSDVLSDWVYAIETKDEARAFIKKMKVGHGLKNMFALGIWLKAENRLVGEIVFFKIDWKIFKMEIGSYIAADLQGQGLISEARKECVRFFSETYKLKRIESVCHINNLPMHKVNIKCGFTQESRQGDFLVFALHP